MHQDTLWSLSNTIYAAHNKSDYCQVGALQARYQMYDDAVPRYTICEQGQTTDHIEALRLHSIGKPVVVCPGNMSQVWIPSLVVNSDIHVDAETVVVSQHLFGVLIFSQQCLVHCMQTRLSHTLYRGILQGTRQSGSM